MDGGDGRQVEPDGMTGEGTQRVERWFVEVAVRAYAAGFDGVQVHVAHFFFLSHFVSPAVNHRTDECGGSTENRVHIVCVIVRGIHEAVPGCMSAPRRPAATSCRESWT